MNGSSSTASRHGLKFTCHGGRFTGRELPNSLDGIRKCLDAGAFRIEIDIHSIDGEDYLVSHANRLEEATTSTGSVGQLTIDAAKQLRRRDAPDLMPPLLSEVVDLVRPYSSDLQLDLKDWRPLTAERVRTLVRLTEPVGRRVIVSSGQDWNLRAIAGEALSLRLGLDPDRYLAAADRVGAFPARLGAYGYRDDHPLAIGRAQSVTEYFRERISNLMRQASTATEFFIERSLLLQAASDDVSLPGILHDRGIAVSAWTLDYDDEGSQVILESLCAIGVDYITTNTTERFQALIGPA